MRKSLVDRVKEFSIILPFMEGREKGEFKRLHQSIVTIVDFGFIKDSDDEGQEYVAFLIKEDSKKFYFGGKVLTSQLKQLEEEGYLEEIQEHGLPVYFDTKKSKNKREYTTVEFFPTDLAVEEKKKSNK